MRLPIRPPHRRGFGQTVSQDISDLWGCPVDVNGNMCCALDEFLGLCTAALVSASGLPISNLTPPAPVAGATTYSPDTQLGQEQGAQAVQTQANQAAGATGGNAGGTLAAAPVACSGLACINTSTWVLLAVGATLAVILTVKQ